MYTENTRWVSSDIQFTRQGFENVRWHHEACQVIQQAFSKPSLVNLISKEWTCYSIYQLTHCWTLFKLAIITYFLFLCWKASLATLFKKCNVSATSSWPDKCNMPRDRKRLLGYVETIQLILGVTDRKLNSVDNGTVFVLCTFLCVYQNN